MITEQLLISGGIRPPQASAFAAPLAAAARRFAIETEAQVAMFLAQVAHESYGFRRLEEDLCYTQPERIRAVFGSDRFPTTADAARFLGRPSALANFVYARRNGNGSEASGDGWRFRGRSPIQLTGRGNYAAASDAIGIDFVADPDAAKGVEEGAVIAAWFFVRAGCLEPANAMDVTDCTRRINGRALLGLDDRRRAFERFLGALRS